MNTDTTLVGIVHKYFDALLSHPKVVELTSCATCKIGCHACCQESLYVSKLEAQHIVNNLTSEQLVRVTERTRQWVARVEGTEPFKAKMPRQPVWRSLNAMCPLNENGMCMVYDSRPIGCRLFFALDDPNKCATSETVGDQRFINFHPKFGYEGSKMLFSQHPIQIDHLSCFLSEILLGQELKSGSRIETSDDGSEATGL